MARLLLAAVAALSVLSLASPARADVPVEAPVGPPSASAKPAAQDEAPMLPGSIMRVLTALQSVGVAEIDKSSALVSPTGPADTARLPVRAPTWLAPEPPRMPLLFSRVVQLTF